jgi:cyclopropane fatty-acyl-phospholipid synthase-like methyltransferase
VDPGKGRGPDTAAAVRAYYDRNTGLFLRMGIGRKTLAIRRAVWADGVTTLEEAANYVNGLIAAEAAGISAAGKLRILDIGCGVGGSLFFLVDAIRQPLQCVGVTISPVQAETARRHAEARGLGAKCRFIAGDFSQAAAPGVFDLAFAIESFVHFPSPSAFFAVAAESLGAGGRLVLADDFLSGNAVTEKTLSPAQARMVEAFRYGWILSSLCTVDRVVQSAAERGLRLAGNRNLSPFITPLPLGAGATRLAVTMMRALPVPGQYWRSSVGSMAQAACRQAGLVEYRVLVFEK